MPEPEREREREREWECECECECECGGECEGDRERELDREAKTKGDGSTKPGEDERVKEESKGKVHVGSWACTSWSEWVDELKSVRRPWEPCDKTSGSSDSSEADMTASWTFIQQETKRAGETLGKSNQICKTATPM